MSKGMDHLNGNKFCAIDIETTGLDPLIHEIYQIAIIPLTKWLDIDKTVMPFFVDIKPQNPELLEWEGAKKNRPGLKRALESGLDSFRAADLLQEWFDNKLKLGHNKYGSNNYKMIPIGHNIGVFDIPFIKQWLGPANYDYMFHFGYRDTYPVSLYINDAAGMCFNTVPFSKNDLSWIAKTLNIPHVNAHDALADAQVAAAVYKAICSKGSIFTWS